MAGSILALPITAHAPLPVKRSSDLSDPAGMCGPGFQWVAGVH